MSTLIHTIQTFAQHVDNVASTHHETLRLLHVYVGVDISVEEHIADVNQSQVQIESSYECQNTEGCQFCGGCECLKVVNARAPREICMQQDGPCIVRRNHQCSVWFWAPNTSIGNGLHARRALNQLPSTIELVSSHFLNKDINPSLGIFVGHGLTK